MTPLHWAIDRGFDNIAELLLDHGANPYLISKFLKTPYSIAKEKNNEFIVNIIETLPNSEVKPDVSYLQEVSEPSKPVKRDRIQSFDAPDVKRVKTTMNDAKNLTLQLLKEQMNMMSGAEDNLIQSALQSGRKIMLSEAGKRILNDSNLNKFLKIPLNTTISSSSSPVVAKKTATVTSRSPSEGGSDVLEIFRDGATASGSGAKKIKPDILNIIRSSTELQEVTITQRSKTSPAPSPTQKTTSVSLSAINVPRAKQMSPPVGDFPEVTGRQFAELSNNHQQLRRLFEREQQKNASLQRQLKQLEVNFEIFKRQQNEKFDSILKLFSGSSNSSRQKPISEGEEDDEEVEEIL